MSLLRSASPLLLGLTACWLVLAGSAVTGMVTLFAVAAVAIALLELVVWPRHVDLDGTLSRLRADTAMRVLALDALLVVAVARGGWFAPWAVAVLGGLLLAGYLLRVHSLVRRGSDFDRAQIRWCNLDVRLPPGRRGLVCWPVLVDLLAVLGVLVGRWGGGPAGPLVGAALLVAAALLLPWLWPGDKTAGVTLADQTRAAVAEALRRLAPRTVVHMAGPAGSTYALRAWVDTLAGLQPQPLVLVREPRHLTAVAGTDLPTVCLPQSTDIEECLPASVRLALYPAHATRNNHVVRLMDIRDVFIGHGDSDADLGASPVARMFDEVWVPGPAGRQRYRRLGLRDDQLRVVGRPQLAPVLAASRRPEPAAAGGPPMLTVLYAPTWEGPVPARMPHRSSLPEMGAPIVAAVTGRPQTRLLLAPHPATGSVRRRYAPVAAELTQRVRGLGEPHRVLTGPAALLAAIAEADVVITDVSSVLTDAVALGRPCLIANPGGLSSSDFRARYPSAVAGALLGPDCADLARLLDDPPAAPAELADRLVAGLHDADAAARFRTAVAAASSDDRPAVQPDMPVAGWVSR